MFRLSLVFAFVLNVAAFLSAERANIVMIVTDEEVVIPPGLRAVLEPWYKEHMPAHNFFKEHGIDFAHHHGGQFACTPARTNLYTGQYGAISRVTQTDGFAKDHRDPGMTWLDENRVPTIGNYLMHAGYDIGDVHYLGKFHLNNRDIVDADRRPILTVGADGNAIRENVETYRSARRLEPYGFSDWIGPDPHGANPLNAGLVRDPDFIEQAIALIQKKTEAYKNDSMKPFFLTVNLVNPHDIVLAIGLWLHGKLHIDPSVPHLPSIPEISQGNFEEPEVHHAYRQIYKHLYSKHPAVEEFYNSEEGRDRIARFYFTLLKKSNHHVKRLLDALAAAPFFENTYVFYTSDHGDLLGRSERYQKWHTLESAVTHVPFYVSHPSMRSLTPEQRAIHTHTSHADMVPTLLGLLDISEERVSQSLKANFTHVHKLVGRDLSPIIRGQRDYDMNRIVYSISEDNISEGNNRIGKLTGFKPEETLFPGLAFPPTEFDTISGRSHVEAIRFFEESHQWAFHRYYNPAEGSDEEFFLYDAAHDPLEIRNLVRHDLSRFTKFKTLLEKERERHLSPMAW